MGGGGGEALFFPSTRTRDLALGPSLFHWESQNSAGRARFTEPIVGLGFARYESHEGERPKALRWRLEREIPAMWLPAGFHPMASVLSAASMGAVEEG